MVMLYLIRVCVGMVRVVSFVVVRRFFILVLLLKDFDLNLI